MSREDTMSEGATMSDRLWRITATYGPDDDPMMWEEAPPADLLAAVRRLVESGTIKGEVVNWCVKHEETTKSDAFCAQGVVYRRKFDCSIVTRLLLDLDSKGFRYTCGDFGDWRGNPVSDGGSET